MSETLAQSGARLCGHLCRNLGWHPEQFWAATPAEIATILTDPAAEATPGIDRNDLHELMKRDDNG